MAPASGSEFDLVKGEWIRLTEPVLRKKASLDVRKEHSRKKSSDYDDMISALKSLTAYAESLRQASNDEIRRLADGIRKLIQ